MYREQKMWGRNFRRTIRMFHPWPVVRISVLTWPDTAKGLKSLIPPRSG